MSENEGKSTIPGVRNAAAQDSRETPEGAEDAVVIPTTAFKAFRTRGYYIGRDEAYGGDITDEDRLFYSLREPAVKWFINDVATDIWDNWFRVLDIADKDSEELNNLLQPALQKLKADQQLPRLSRFERRYGTSLLLLSYTGFDNSWETPLFELDAAGNPPRTLPADVKLLQITPFQWTSVEVAAVDEDAGSLRYGLPELYRINMGSTGTGSGSNATTQQTITVHWTRTIHDAVRLDEHPYLGVSAVDILFDDAVGYRNSKWAQYKTLFRYGSGFPVIQTQGTSKENEDWVTGGGVNDMLNVQGYFVHGEGESITFKGVEGVALNPTPYNDMAFTNFATATRIAQDTLKGVSAGRVTGSEVNERQYFRFISLQQNETEFVIRELIDRLIQTGQVPFEGEYVVDWFSAFEVNPQDQAAMDFMSARTNDLKLSYMTINEVRELNGLPPREDGDMIVGRAGAVNPSNQQNPSPAETNPEETEDPEMDRTLFETAKEMLKHE